MIGFLGGVIGYAVGLEAVLFLEGAYRSDRIGIICAGGRPLQVAQLNQRVWSSSHCLAFVALLHGDTGHRAQGLDAVFAVPDAFFGLPEYRNAWIFASIRPVSG